MRPNDDNIVLLSLVRAQVALPEKTNSWNGISVSWGSDEYRVSRIAYRVVEVVVVVVVVVVVAVLLLLLLMIMIIILLILVLLINMIILAILVNVIVIVIVKQTHNVLVRFSMLVKA